MRGEERAGLKGSLFHIVFEFLIYKYFALLHYVIPRKHHNFRDWSYSICFPGFMTHILILHACLTSQILLVVTQEIKLYHTTFRPYNTPQLSDNIYDFKMKLLILAKRILLTIFGPILVNTYDPPPTCHSFFYSMMFIVVHLISI